MVTQLPQKVAEDDRNEHVRDMRKLFGVLMLFRTVVVVEGSPFQAHTRSLGQNRRL